MENLLVLPEFLKNKYFVKGKYPKNTALLKENPLVLPEFLKKTTLTRKNPLKMSEFLRNKCFVKGKSHNNI
jgi:hypothetical protein